MDTKYNIFSERVKTCILRNFIYDLYVKLPQEKVRPSNLGAIVYIK